MMVSGAYQGFAYTPNNAPQLAAWGANATTGGCDGRDPAGLGR